MPASVSPPARLIIFSAFLLSGISSRAEKNDLMFPAAPAANSAVGFDGKGFLIHGKRTFLSAGSIHYPRVPSALWQDRLLRLKRGSFNTVETYAFWNLHEPRENEFDFSGEKDIGKFFETAQKAGLHAIARVGPYVCAEWDFGGYPIWLKFKPPFNLRTDDPAYLALNDHWYDRIVPIVAKHQIHRGGNVILVQLENEHPKGWGKIDGPYFKHLSRKALGLGIEVPHFMSGMNHGQGPGVRNPDTSMRSSPWFSTEFWPGWFNLYGPLQSKKLAAVESAQWNIMARGGAGQNFYMAHGGSNFETWNDPSGAASYDYGAAIGQAGDLRPVFYRMKRANQLAQSCPEVLANGDDATSTWKDLLSGDARVIGARRSPAGTLVFVSNPKNTLSAATFKDGTSIHFSPQETCAFPRDLLLGRGLAIKAASVRLLGMASNGSTTTVIVHGLPGDVGSIEFTAPLTKSSHGKSFKQDGPAKWLIATPDNGPDECLLQQGPATLRIVAVSSDLGLRTWIIGEPGQQHIVCGPSFIGLFKPTPNGPAMVVERPYGMPSCGRAVVYGAMGETHHLLVPGDRSLDDQPAPALTGWASAPAPEAAPAYDDSKWKSSQDPVEMGADGDTSAFAWYRATVDLPAGGSGVLEFDARDHVRLFVNRKTANPLAPVTKNARRSLSAEFKAGKNSIAIFTSHSGRNKAFNHLGPALNFDNKGVFSPVTLKLENQSLPIKGWRMRGGIQPSSAAWKPSGTSAGGLPTLYRTSFRAAAPAASGACPILRVITSSLTRGTVWINGKNLGRYPDTIPAKGIYIPECWLKNGDNELVLFDEHGADPSKVRLAVETAASRELIAVSRPADTSLPMIVPEENPRRDLNASNQGNLAFGRTATASTSQRNRDARLAADGDIDTGWCADSANPGAWLQIDLGTTTTAATCEIAWEREAKHYQYNIEGSSDARQWTRLGDHGTAVPSSPDSPSEVSRVNFQPSPVRFLRVTVTGGLDQQTRWPSIQECRVFAP